MNRQRSAGTAEILRSSQKDEEYLQYMRNLVSNIIQSSLGVPHWLKWKDITNTISDFIFYNATSLSGLQTIGEEYSNIIQIDKSLKSIPSYWMRFIDVGLRTFGYYFALRLQKKLENYINLLSTTNKNTSSLPSQVMYSLPVLFKAITVLQRIHLVLFYLSGSYYSISKRFTGIRFAVIRRWLFQSNYQKPYRVLGYLTASQLCLSLLVSLYSFTVQSASSSNKDSPIKSSNEIVNSKNQCSLCYEVRSHSTLTPCGHLFCWSCITSWMQTKEECPLCRESCPPSKLVYLQNYY